MQKISILGCGWLGFPLAKSLLERNFSVKGSTTSEEKIFLLERTGISPFQISLHENKIDGNMVDFLQDSELLIIDIPPKLRGNATENFVAKIRNLIPFIEESSVEKIIFVSSTSVYSDDNSIITEVTNPKPETESARQLLEAEQLLKDIDKKTTIVRFGGLIGEDRHPIHFLASKKGLENPEAPINFIHQKDCIGIFTAIIENDCWNETFNAVAPQHPLRKEYYTKKAIELNLEIPEFDHSKPSVGKIISSEKIQQLLGYKFQIPIH